MRMTRFRFTVRGMMVALAIVAALIACEKARRSRASRLAVAADHEKWGATLGLNLRLVQELIDDDKHSLRNGYSDRDRILASIAAWQPIRDEYEAIVAYHAALGRKYRRAAARPWEVVAPDPPEPPIPQLVFPVEAPSKPSPDEGQGEPAEVAIPDLPAESGSPFDREAIPRR